MKTGTKSPFSVLDDIFNEKRIKAGYEEASTILNGFLKDVKSTINTHTTDLYDGVLIRSEDTGAFFEVELPGITKEEINISVDDANYTLEVSTARVKQTVGGIVTHNGRNLNDVSKKFKLTKDSDLENITTTFENGLLVVFLPLKKTQSTVRSIKL